MDFQEAWQKALEKTEIIRSRVKSLYSDNDTKVPYILLSESSVNLGDTVVRTGEVLVNRPSLIMPPHNPILKGFEIDQVFDSNEDMLVNFFIVRGIHLPSMKYLNKTNSLDIYEGDISKAILYHKDLLQRQENVLSGLLTGPEDCWQFSILLYVCSQIVRNAESDIRHLLKQYKKNKR